MIIPSRTTLLALAIAAGSMTSLAAAQSWTAPVDGIWFDSTKWTPAVIPTGAGAVGTLGLVGPYTVTTASNTLLGLNITNSQVLLGTNPGSSLVLVGSGPGVVNVLNGQLVVNATAAYSGTSLNIGAPSVTFSGTGAIRLNASSSDSGTTVGTSRVFSSGGGTLVMGAGTTLGGFGIVNDVPATNNGTFAADISGRVLRVQGSTNQNNNLFTATGGGNLVLVNCTINQSGAGRLVAGAGSLVTLQSCDVSGGTITTDPTGQTAIGTGTNSVDGVSINGGLDLIGGTTTSVGAAGLLLNNGATLAVNSNSAYAGTHLRFGAVNTPITGTGTVRLSASPSDSGTTVQTAAINADGAGSVVIGSNINLAGFGIVLSTPTTNNGVVAADVTGRPLRIDGGTHQNNNLFTATNGGALVLVGDSITQAPGGAISAVGASPDTTVNSNVQLANTDVTGGSLVTTGAARVQVNAGAGAALAGVGVYGGLDCYGGSDVYIDPPGITLNGGATLLVNVASAYAGTHLRTGGVNVPINGSGVVRLSASPSDSGTTVQTAAVADDTSNPGGSFVFAPGVTLAGFGIVSSVPTVNNGVFAADINGRPLRIQGSSHQNNNLYSAVNGGTLMIVGATVNQAVGAGMTAGDGSAVVLSDTSIIGGSIGSPTGGTGITSADNSTVVLDGVRVSRQMNLSPGGVLNLASNLVLDGALVAINPDGAYAGTRLVASGTPSVVSGTGTIRLKASPSDSGTTVGTADIASGGATGSGLSITSGVMIDGFGRISSCPTTNDGKIQANVAARPLRIDGETHQNNNRYEASNGGSLVLAGTTINQSSTGVIDAGNGSLVTLSSGTVVNGGSFTSGGNGRFVAAGNSSVGGVASGVPLDITGGSSLTVLPAGLVNNGLVNVNAAAAYAGTALYSSASGTTLTGVGEVRLNRSASDSSGTVGTADIRPLTADNSFVFGAGQVLSGSGRVTLPVTMSGTVSPGVGTGGIDFIRNEGGATMTFTSTGRLLIERAATSEFDTLVNAGTVNFGGTLQVNTATDLAAGTTMDVVTGGTMSGQFAQVVSNGLAAPKRFGARYDIPDRVRVTVLCGPADIAGQGADGNGDGLLNNNDFIVFIDRFFNNDPRADVGTTGGVPGNDGAFDNNDFIVFIDLFFAGCF